MSLLEHGQKCTGWIDRLGKCNWSEACALHDRRYMTPKGKDMDRLDADLELFCGVYKKCAPMAYIMFIGVRVFGGKYWEKYEEARNATI